MQTLFASPRGLRLGMVSALAVCAASIGMIDAAQATPAPKSNASIVAGVPRVQVKDLGHLAANTPVRLSIELNYRNPAALEAFIQTVANPDSPQFGHYLTPAQFEAEFAPTVADYARAVSTLRAAGFTVGTSPTRSLIEASAPAAVVNKYFSTDLHAVAQPNASGLRYANAAPAYIPSGLRDITYGVAGFNNLVVAKPANIRGTRGIDTALGAPLQGPDTGLGPYAFASAYNLPVQYARPSGGTYDGTGHAAGIAIDSDLQAPGDLAGFLSYFGIKQTGPALKRILVDGGPLSIVNGDSVETNLDVETISSLAPGAATYLYLMPDLSTQHIVDTYSKVVADDKIDALNSSFGGCEIADNLSQLSDHIAIQGAAEGITFSASSGDGGASLCIGPFHYFLGVSAPASAPHFTSVGGTSLIVAPAGAYRLEYAWTGSGGGVSVRFPLPAYQKGIKTAITSGRNVPDIAFDADPGTGAAFYYNGLFQGPIGGTSLSSPIFVAYVLERNEIAGARAGAIDATLYSRWEKYGYGNEFRDITIGNNFTFGPNSGYAGYYAGTGYDVVTGIGSLIGTPNAK